MLRSLTILEQALGTDHPDVAISLYNLAELLRLQGDYAEAEPMYRRTLAIEEKALGLNHPTLAKTLGGSPPCYARRAGAWKRKKWRTAPRVSNPQTTEDSPGVRS